MDRIREDYCVEVSFGDESVYLIDPRYDRIDRFKWLGANILRVITEEGMAHIHVTDQDADRLIEGTGIPVCYPEFMVRKDYENYLEGQANSLEEWYE